MTLKKAAAITGLTIEQDGLHLRGLENGRVVVEARGANLRQALTALVQQNWTRVSYLCFERDGWKCRLCGGQKHLNAHHVVYRSHGRRDMLDNLATICQDPEKQCHDDVHERKKKVPEVPWPY